MSDVDQQEHRLLHIDCFSGIAGDMMLAALLDLDDGCATAIRNTLGALDHLGFRFIEEEVVRSGIGAKRVIVEVDESKQHGRHLKDIEQMLRDRSGDAEGAISAAVLARTMTMFRALAEAEGQVHRRPPEAVHFHEVGAVDSIVDIVGVAAGLEHLGAEVHSTRIPLGHGFIECQHGTIPIPAPATLALLKDKPVYGTTVEAELVTPTGAVILATQVLDFGPLPVMTPQAIGWGAGTRENPGRPGLLRLVLGTSPTRNESPNCFVLEANIDDMTAEVAAHVLEQLMSEGALDAWISPITMKKGRPAMQLGVLTRAQDQDRLARVVLRETTSIGLRYHEVGRVELTREIIKVETPFGELPVKVSSSEAGPLNASPEFEACRAAAREHDTPLKKVLAVAMAEALKKL